MAKTHIRFSEAVRLGAMLTKQARGDYFRYGRGGEVVATCAYGAALLAVGAADKENRDSQPRWPYMRRLAVCPARGCGEVHRRSDLVMHLNDDHRWSRERIAAWVETLEWWVKRVPAQAPVEASVRVLAEVL